MMAAVMTEQPFWCPVKRERDAAVWAGDDVSAFAAHQERRITAAIQEEDALLLSAKRVREGAVELVANHVGVCRRCGAFAWCIGAVPPPQVEHVDLRQPSPTHALGKIQQRVLSRLGVRPALERRCSAAEHDNRSFESRAHDRNFAGMIPRRLALLVARLVLLIDDYRTDVGQRSENRGARANGNTPFAAAKRQPCVVPLAIAQRRRQHRNAVPENSAARIPRLRRQRDFRDENNSGLSLLQDKTLQHLDVHERLSAARHAVQQEYFARLGVSYGSYCLSLRNGRPMLRHR